MDPFSHVQHFNFSAFEKAFETAKTANNFIFLSKTTFFNLFYFYDVSEMLRSYLYSGVESSLSSTVNSMAPILHSRLDDSAGDVDSIHSTPHHMIDERDVIQKNIDVRIANKL